MFVKVHKALDTPACTNKGSCGLLGKYLEKENVGKDLPERMPFFNHNYDEVAKLTAINSIDNNVRNLGRKDAKFFMITVNPSHSELQHLIKESTGRAGIEDFAQLNKVDQEKVYIQLRQYTRGVMDIYAENFNRPQVKDGGDLVYFAKIEVNRKWHAWDREVRQGKAVAGRQKEGLNLHIHVVVSRNDRSQQTKLSPQSRSRGGKQLLNGKEVEQGFDHVRFKERSGELFRDRYHYQGSGKESYRGLQRGNGRSNTLGGVTGSLQGKAKGVIKNELTQGHFKTEKKLIGAAGQAVRLAKAAANPKAAALMAAQKLFAILKGDTGLEL